MRDIEYWLGKFKTVSHKVNELKGTVRHHEMVYKYWIKPYKLKTQRGHAFNNDYTGWKVDSRRKAWFKKRGVCLSKAGDARREAKRLETTKLAFYAKKIIELGGKVPERWS